jgi:two-component sensor histidine kinase
VKLSSKKAVPVGLIVNELVTNAYKYAFPPDYGEGKIKIKMHQHPDGTMTLQVIDNGPETKNKTVKEGFGSKLIRALSNQLGADMQLQTEHGHAYTFNFKIV